MLSFRQLLRACGLVLRVVVPIAAIVLIDLAALHYLYKKNPAKTNTVADSVDFLIARAQIRRALEASTVDIAFFGDSSCLMGVDPRIVAREIDAKLNIQSFCTSGFIGPAGNAKLIEAMIERNTAPKAIVVMFHPAGFKRLEAWDYWPAFVASELVGAFASPSRPFPRSALDFLQVEWIRRLIYQPLHGSYGLYYGDARSLQEMLSARQGSMIDPNKGLSAVEAPKWRVPLTGPAADYSINEQYQDALNDLAATLKKLPNTPVYLLIGPVPDYKFRPGASAERDQRLTAMADTLNIPHDRILRTRPTMFASQASGVTHLNRWGQAQFSVELAKLLDNAIRQAP